MTPYDTRRERLRELIHERGPTSLAHALGHSNGSYISQLAGPHPTKQVSERVARGIEEKLHLPDGWLDGAERPVLIEQVLVDVTRAVLAEADRTPPRPAPEKLAEVIALAYQMARTTSAVSPAMIAKLLHLTR